jgi:ferric-dicitrate binding protein FerR (iron transport regulator)
LEGEAFFDVTHNKSKPFVVETKNNLQVEVLGTTFNVSSYADDNAITTYLKSGKVKINIEGEEAIFLKPSEVLKFEKANGIAVKQAIDDERYFDWTKGILNINGETIEEFAKKLERRFDIEIIFGDNEVPNHNYSGSIKDEDLNTVLAALEYLSSLNYKKEGRVVTLFSKK